MQKDYHHSCGEGGQQPVDGCAQVHRSEKKTEAEPQRSARRAVTSTQGEGVVEVFPGFKGVPDHHVQHVYEVK